MEIPLTAYLLVGAALFGIGLFNVLARRHVIRVLMGVELMLNAANLNLVAFGRYVHPQDPTGQAFALFGIAVAAAEVAVGLALIVAIYRTRRITSVDEVDALRH